MQFPVSRTRLGRLTLATLLITAILVATFYGTNFFKVQTPKALATGGYAPIKYDIFRDWATWPYSHTLKQDAAWSTLLMPARTWNAQNSIGEMPLRQFIDLNGDGMLDFIFSDGVMNIGGTWEIYELKSVVLLNNGHGWDIAFKCIAQADNKVPANSEFRGDCAQQ